MAYTTYVLRSMYGLLYMPFSASVYRLGEPLLYYPKVKINSVFGIDKRYITYQEALKYYPEEVVESWKYDTSLELEIRYSKYLLDHPDFKN